MSYIIYKYTSKTTGKSYIGQTNQPLKRIKAHKKANKEFAFSNAIKKYGFDDFTYEILESNIDINEANKKECFYIEKLNTLSPHGYNLRHGGDNAIFSEESKKKISIAKSGKPLSDSHKKAISTVQTGKKRKPHSDETKQKISNSNTGLKRSDETRLKISKSKQSMSDITKMKISNAKKGKSLSESHRINIRNSNIGHFVSEETKEKISIANKGKGASAEMIKRLADEKRGKKQSEETKAKRKATWEAKWLNESEIITAP